jgi:hypothetical protein
MPGRLLVGAGGADKNELPAAAAEQADIPLHIGGKISNPIDDHVKMAASQELLDGGIVRMNVGVEDLGTIGSRVFGGRRAVNKRQLMAALQD